MDEVGFILCIHDKRFIMYLAFSLAKHGAVNWDVTNWLWLDSGTYLSLELYNM